MKKLGKLNINSEKLMKNEELLKLRGGYDYYCYLNLDGFRIVPLGPISGSDCDTVVAQLNAYWGGGVSCTGGDCSYPA